MDENQIQPVTYARNSVKNDFIPAISQLNLQVGFYIFSTGISIASLHVKSCSYLILIHLLLPLQVLLIQRILDFV